MIRADTKKTNEVTGEGGKEAETASIIEWVLFIIKCAWFLFHPYLCQFFLGM